MKVYFSMDDQLTKLGFADQELDILTGWGKLIVNTKKYMQDYGFEFVPQSEADIEFYLGQPPMKTSPSMQPNVCLTMYESSRLPRSWVKALNNWDIVINPSNWGAETFFKSGVNSEIKVMPLWVDEAFTFKERIDISRWNFIVMAVQLTDRKNAKLVIDLFMENKMPKDAQLIIKTLPTTQNPSMWNMYLSENVRYIQYDFELAQLVDLVHQCHVSVNPSAGEGFGFIPLEHQRTGCCAILSNFSALSDLCGAHNLPLHCEVVPSPFTGLRGQIGAPDIDDLLKLMLWTYEHREKALELGRNASLHVSKCYSSERFLIRLEQIFTSAIKQHRKKIFPELECNYIASEINRTTNYKFR